MDSKTVNALATNAQAETWAWEPLTKGEAQACRCDREGCCTFITVLDQDENVLEIYQGSLVSMWSCIARVVLPEDLALCRKVQPK
jgi:hypothetical protein